MIGRGKLEGAGAGPRTDRRGRSIDQTGAECVGMNALPAPGPRAAVPGLAEQTL